MPPLRLVHLYNFPEILTAKTVVIFGAHGNCRHRQAEYEPNLHPEGMRLGSDVDNQLLCGNIRVELLIS